MNRILISILAFICLYRVNASNAEQITLPEINGAKMGETAVYGRSVTGSAPITIYDLSYPARTALGSGKSMDDNGNFAVLVSPSLIAGHEIVAVDKDGNTSQPVVVIAPDPQLNPAQ